MIGPRYRKLSYRIFGRRIEDKESTTRAYLSGRLASAGISLRPSAYLAICYMNSAVAFLVLTLLVVLAAGLTAAGVVAIPPEILLPAAPVPLVVAGMTWVGSLLYPDMKADTRARKLDVQLPYALNYMATMAQAGTTPERIFESLADQPLYGEVAQEAARIDRDLKILGKDVVGALTDAADRSPSAKWEDFLEGALTTLTTGGDLEEYLISKNEQFTQDQRQNQEQFIENLGLIAEAFVTVGVAGPLLFVILLTVMVSFGGGGGLQGGYLLALGILPLTHAGFAATIAFITPEV